MVQKIFINNSLNQDDMTVESVLKKIESYPDGLRDYLKKCLEKCPSNTHQFFYRNIDIYIQRYENV